jgi:hypothetical protein
MKTKNKIHDGIVGALLLASILLGALVDPRWLYAAGGLSALQRFN